LHCSIQAVFIPQTETVPENSALTMMMMIRCSLLSFFVVTGCTRLVLLILRQNRVSISLPPNFLALHFAFVASRRLLDILTLPALAVANHSYELQGSPLLITGMQ